MWGCTLDYSCPKHSGCCIFSFWVASGPGTIAQIRNALKLHQNNGRHTSRKSCVRIRYRMISEILSYAFSLEAEGSASFLSVVQVLLLCICWMLHVFLGLSTFSFCFANCSFTSCVCVCVCSLYVYAALVGTLLFIRLFLIHSYFSSVSLCTSGRFYRPYPSTLGALCACMGQQRDLAISIAV